MERVRVVIISALEIAREALALLIASQPNFEVVGTFAESELVIAASEELRPQIYLFQISQNNEAVRADFRNLLGGVTAPAVVVLAQEIQTEALRELKKVEASGYVLHDAGVGLLCRVLESVAHGRRYVDTRVAEFMLSSIVQKPTPPLAAPERQLSKREEEVLRLVAQGHTMNQIALLLGLSIKTVDTHKARAKLKIGVSDKAGIVRYAIAQGWMEQPAPARPPAEAALVG